MTKCTSLAIWAKYVNALAGVVAEVVNNDVPRKSRSMCYTCDPYSSKSNFPISILFHISWLTYSTLFTFCEVEILCSGKLIVVTSSTSCSIVVILVLWLRWNWNFELQHIPVRAVRCLFSLCSYCTKESIIHSSPWEFLPFVKDSITRVYFGFLYTYFKRNNDAARIKCNSCVPDALLKKCSHTWRTGILERKVCSRVRVNPNFVGLLGT